MKTKLLEFKNKYGSTLRGILSYSENSDNKAVVMMGGFERSATTEAKFKKIADELANHKIASFRFDHTGMGLSDGDFSKISIQSLKNDLLEAIAAVKKEISYQKISFLSHSLPPCIMADQSLRNVFEKIVLISPALNQKDLLRYWFIKSLMKKRDPQINITWENYRKYLDEEKFLNYCNDPKKLTKARFAGAEYYLENKDKDYSLLIPDEENILHVHGEKDETVPLTSLNTEFKNKIIVKDGDHDIERVDFFKQWAPRTIEFLK